MGVNETMAVVRGISDDKLKTWQVRSFVAIGTMTVDAEDRTMLSLILRAALGIKGPKPGLTFLPHLGENAVINKRKELWSRYTDERSKDIPRLVCTVDELNRSLGWLIGAIEATDAERTEIMNKIAAWIVRDETAIAEHVERQRAGLDEPYKIPSDVLEDVAAADEAHAKRQEKAGKA